MNEGLIHLLRRRQTVKISNHGLEVGVYNDYQIGDIVVWSGAGPCIGYINKLKPEENGLPSMLECINRSHGTFGEPYEDCYGIDDIHNSLHFSYLRYAVSDEIDLLLCSGKNKISLSD